MKTSRDRSRRDASNAESDPRVHFEKLWRELDGLEKRQADPDLAPRRVRLECNGELLDTGSVGPMAARYSSPGGELVAYDCPRCDRRHESLLLR
jgi:hypothetical protein